ncbi:MAG: hypothetical protein EBU23_04505, partial [Mycobacteriaceae bacterium]|nr:hypothetical protein [Mycobacteriaceae bacterium]
MDTTSLAAATGSQVTPGEAVIDLGAVAHNVRVLREHAGPAQVMAVVKADGYGHGATAVARAALAAGVAELGVATVEEALALRRDGITAPVLAWLHPPGTDFAPALTADIQVGISSATQIEEVAAAAAHTGRTAEVTIKVDTGLNRNGVGINEYPAVLDALARATAPSTMTRPDLAFDMVRPGVAVYGLSPIPGRGDMGLRPAMTLRCRVAMVKRPVLATVEKLMVPVRARRTYLAASYTHPPYQAKMT